MEQGTEKLISYDSIKLVKRFKINKQTRIQYILNTFVNIMFMYCSEDDQEIEVHVIKVHKNK